MCICQHCGKKYRIDLLISDRLWKIIRPKGKKLWAGLLCGGCIMNKLEDISGYDYWFLTKKKE